MDKSNKFNKLNDMQKHMSYLIAKQNGEKTNDYVESGKNNKKDSEKENQIQPIQTIMYLLQAHQKTKERPH
jgi:hypothetical protein